MMAATLFRVLIPISLVLTTWGLGMGLQRRDLELSLANPRLAWMGVIWWLVLPAVAFAIAAYSSAPRDVRIGVALLGAVPVGFVANVFASYVRGQVAITLFAVGATTLLAPLTLGLWGTAIAVHYGVSGPTRLADVMAKVFPILLFGTLPAIAGYFVGQHVGDRRTKIAKGCRDLGTLILATAFLFLMVGDIHALARGLRDAALPVLMFDAICFVVGWVCARRVASANIARSAWLTCFLRQEETGIFFATTCLGLPGATAPFLVNVVIAMSVGVAFTLVARLFQVRSGPLSTPH
jgi:predicted Na+-dependent transporter